MGYLQQIAMANKGFDFPSNSVVVDPMRMVTPPWGAWVQRVHDVAIASQQSGATADRPTAGLWIGRQFYDTTLGKPVWVQSVRPTVWVDATGAPV